MADYETTIIYIHTINVWSRKCSMLFMHIIYNRGTLHLIFFHVLICFVTYNEFILWKENKCTLYFSELSKKFYEAKYFFEIMDSGGTKHRVEAYGLEKITSPFKEVHLSWKREAYQITVFCAKIFVR